MRTQSNYRQELQNWERQNEHNWKLYEASVKRIDILEERQGSEDDKTDKWMMTMAAGSFGLSFAFIDRFVNIQEAVHIAYLIAAWSCFTAILLIGIIGFKVSSFLHTLLAKEESEALALKYKGIMPENRKRSIFFGANAVLGYIQILFFIGGLSCLFLFIAKNLL